MDVGPPPASLSLWIMNPPAGAGQPVRGTVLLLHGIRCREESQLDFARVLSRAGFRSVLVDLRGHGRSSGDWLSYGVVEAREAPAANATFLAHSRAI